MKNKRYIRKAKKLLGRYLKNMQKCKKCELQDSCKLPCDVCDLYNEEECYKVCIFENNLEELYKEVKNNGM